MKLESQRNEFIAELRRIRVLSRWASGAQLLLVAAVVLRLSAGAAANGSAPLCCATLGGVAYFYLAVHLFKVGECRFTLFLMTANAVASGAEFQQLRRDYEALPGLKDRVLELVLTVLRHRNGRGGPVDTT